MYLFSLVVQFSALWFSSKPVFFFPYGLGWDILFDYDTTPTVPLYLRSTLLQSDTIYSNIFYKIYYLSI